MITLLDVCAGIGSFSLAAHRHGIKTVAQIEIDPQRREVLAKHFPDVLRLEDICNVRANDIPRPISILAGGTPCQDLSLAGQRAGLDGEKSQIWYEYLRLAQELKPEWLVWENVPGALSSNKGRDFLTILRGLDECGYHVAWRVLDAQYFGVPQRRRRVFLVGHLRDGRAAQVLFESESMPGNSKTRPKKRQKITKVAGTISASGSGTARSGNGDEIDMLVTHSDVSGTLARNGGYGTDKNELDMLVFNQQGFGDYRQSPIGKSLLKSDDITTADLILTVDLQSITSIENRSTPSEIAPSLTKRQTVVAFNPQASSTASTVARPDDKAGTLGTTRVEGVLQHNTIRRLTPTECERLQGFPDRWTEGHADSRRYSMLGDSIAVPCSEWILKRIVQFSD